MNNVKVERYDPITKQFVPFVSTPASTTYYFITENLQGDPTSYCSDPDSDEGHQEFDTAEKARVAGLNALNRLDEGRVTIWKNSQDVEGNGESEILWEYKRTKYGPSKTEEVDPETGY